MRLSQRGPVRSRALIVAGLIAVTGLSVAPMSSSTAAGTPAAGALDPSFGSHGTVTLPGGESIALGPGGTVWVLGSVVYTTGTTRYLNRFTAAGKHDPRFTGPTETSNAADLSTGPLITDPAGGASFAVNLCCRTAKPPTSEVAVHTVSVAGKRLSGTAGTASWPMSSLVASPGTDADYVLGGVVRLSDGRLRACVSVYPGGNAAPFAALVGFLANGSIDTRFGTADTTMTAPGWVKVPGLADCGFASAGLQQLMVDGDNRLYVEGTATGVTPSATRVVRTSAAGVVDPGYGTGGQATVSGSTRSYSPLTGLAEANGAVFLGLSSRGTEAGAQAAATVVALTPAGARDSRFGSHGVSRLFPAGGSSELDSIGTLPGGRLIIGLVYTFRDVRAGRLTAISSTTGARAAGFGTGGTVVTKTLTWGTVVQGKALLTIGAALPADPKAYLGATVLQRRTL